MNDQIVRIGKSKNSIIQHGKYNNRIYLMRLAETDLPDILDEMDRLAQKNRYTKIFCKVPRKNRTCFLEHNYQKEARIPRYYDGQEDVLFMSKFLDQRRSQLRDQETIKKVLETAKIKQSRGRTPQLDGNYHFRIACEEDAPAITEVYKKVFATYPFPIHEINYIKKTLQANVIYFGLWDEEQLVALSSAEMDFVGKNVEMTDFATLPAYRGKGFASFLLANMESKMRASGFKTAYTIARALSFGMNITFAKTGYQFGGTLINNTNISGNVESMNIWYKAL